MACRTADKPGTEPGGFIKMWPFPQTPGWESTHSRLPAAWAEAPCGLVAYWHLPLYNPTSLPFFSQALIPNKEVASQTLSQHLLLENPICNMPQRVWFSSSFSIQFIPLLQGPAQKIPSRNSSWSFQSGTTIHFTPFTLSLWMMLASLFSKPFVFYISQWFKF